MTQQASDEDILQTSMRGSVGFLDILYIIVILDVYYVNIFNLFRYESFMVFLLYEKALYLLINIEKKYNNISFPSKMVFFGILLWFGYNVKSKFSFSFFLSFSPFSFKFV